MLRKTLATLLTLGTLVSACYAGDSDAQALVVSRADIDALADGESLTVDLRGVGASARFDLGDGPIDLRRVVILRREGIPVTLQELVITHGVELGINVFDSDAFTLDGAALIGLDAALPIPEDGQAFVQPTQSVALDGLPRIDSIRLDGRALPRFVVGDLGVLSAGDAASGAIELMRGLAPAFRLGEGHDFEVLRVDEDALGQVHVRMQLYIDDLPVIGGEVIVHAEAATGGVRAIQSQLAAEVARDDRALIDAEVALSVASAGLPGVDPVIDDAPDLVYVMVDGRPILAYAAAIAYEGEEGPERDIVFADAHSGALVARHPQIHRGLYRKVYSANNTNSVPGTLKISEGQSSADTSVQAAYDNAGVTYNYFKTKFNRDSYNNNGATLNATVHYSKNYNNAYWDGYRMVYGDGDNYYFKSLALSPDIVVHELSHAVTQYTSNLQYYSESGALNEAFSDIMAAAAQIWQAGGVSSATWKLAEDVWTPGQSGDAMRYMDDPTKDGQSYDYYPERYTGNQDNGGVHINSGIANLAFKLVVAGGSHPRGKTNIAVNGIGVAKAEQIFYRAFTTYMGSQGDFEDARGATAQAAADLYGSAEVAVIHAAWDAVGVPGSPGNGGNNGGNNGGDPQCAGTPYGGSLSGKGAAQHQPGGSYYYSNKSGTHTGCLTGPANADFDLYLQKWNGSAWSTVAKSEGETSSETINYNGSAGYYTWRVSSWSGSGAYSLTIDPP